MSRSRIEHALAKSVVDAAPPPSELALDAIIAGIPVEQTRPPVAGHVDVVWPASRLSL
ncbi:hypothetical protein [Rhodococcus sp. H29-C3]|uniref:hypothetical protein n=1 Tax=Rhodococcus sp. H29-C3 TaxID=3046307 RepID=UPI0024B92C15|nr:hypothetical protein [Rhodococcus sp. H29-C3]MDJ0363441.1 hypothetical protein [Rhodococcus sp. H29-C3]